MRSVRLALSDADILAAIRQHGNRSTTSTVRSILAHKFDMLTISTPWVLHQLKRLEREGKAHRIVSTVWKVQYVWVGPES